MSTLTLPHGILSMPPHPSAPPAHHPGEPLLLDYAGGALGEGASLAIATHLALCPACRHTVREMEAAGGALLEELEPEPLEPGGLERLLARLDEAPAEPPRRLPPSIQTGAPFLPPFLPEPLRGRLARLWRGGPGEGDLSGLPWRRSMPGLAYVNIPTNGGARTRLLRLQGGSALPEHTHHGIELALVLRGGFSDEFHQFLPGDIGVGDDAVTHRPVADPEGCLCLSVADGEIRMTGSIGRFLNRFIRV
ncbi:ChrR family anti-sigma-E factor [Azospirillum sp. SYSU D00513]|uniref:ChrR family anti-sigma-E factor n=1 Tax=Azospirillum sp. SYSU D00513 TaxID=2812561 RepID=UPI001FFE6807|nr:ChrR family anti-sigma-E factor [Azospirillum sp. SYSU D00513]